MFGRTKWTRTRRLRSHADRTHSEAKKLLRKTIQITGLLLTGLILSLVVPGIAGGDMSLRPLWAIRLTDDQIHTDEYAQIRESELSLLPLWVAPYLYYIDPLDGELIGKFRYESGVAYSSQLHGSAISSDGVFSVFQPDGKPAFRIQSDGRLLFRADRPYIAGHFLDRIESYSTDGRLQWRHRVSDVITTLSASADHTIIGTSDGQVMLVTNEGNARSIRDADGQPVAAAALDNEMIYLIIAGKHPVLEFRALSSPELLADAMAFPGDESLSGPTYIELNPNSLYVPDYALLVGRQGDAHQLPSGAVYRELGDFFWHMILQDANDEQNREPESLLEIRDRWGGTFVKKSAAAGTAADSFNGDLLLWNEDFAVLYRIGIGSNSSVNGGGSP